MLRVGDFVKHKKFGIGKVLNISGDRAMMKAKIFFIDSNSIIIKSDIKDYVKDIIINKDFINNLSDDELDKLQDSPDYILLKDVRLHDDNKAYQNINEAITGFKTELNTEDFNGKFYLEDERNYKVYFHNNAKKLLGKDILKELIESKNHEQLIKNLKDTFSSYYKEDKSNQNLTHYLEQTKLIDSLDSEENIENYFIALYNILYEDNEFENRFRNWIDVLESIGHGKWTMATILLFIIHPDKHMYVKPETTKNALILSGFHAAYYSRPSYSYYKTVLKCSQYIFEKTTEAGMNPKDMIDIQSFMWCIRPEYDNKSRAHKDK